MDFAVILKAVNDFVWGPFMLVLLVGTGVFLTIRLNFLHGAIWICAEVYF